MAKVAEEREIADEIAKVISAAPYGTTEEDEVSALSARLMSQLNHFQDDLKAALDELEQEQLDNMLAGATHAPIHNPDGPSRISGKLRTSQLMTTNLTCAFTAPPAAVKEDDEDAELRQLQAELAM